MRFDRRVVLAVILCFRTWALYRRDTRVLGFILGIGVILIGLSCVRAIVMLLDAALIVIRMVVLVVRCWRAERGVAGRRLSHGFVS